MMQLDFFSSAASHHKDKLETARNIAIELARVKGKVSVETVREAILTRGINILEGEYKNWMGSIFRGKEWVSVGWEASRHSEAHGRPVRVWMLRDMYEKRVA